MAICYIIIVLLAYTVCSNKITLQEILNFDLGIDGREQADVSANSSHVADNYGATSHVDPEPVAPLHLSTQPACMESLVQDRGTSNMSVEQGIRSTSSSAENISLLNPHHVSASSGKYYIILYYYSSGCKYHGSIWHYHGTYSIIIILSA